MKDPLYKNLKSKLIIQIVSIRDKLMDVKITAGNSNLYGIIVNIPSHSIPKGVKYNRTFQFIIGYGSIKKPIGMTYGNYLNDHHVLKRFKGCVSMFLYRQLKLRMSS